MAEFKVEDSLGFLVSKAHQSMKSYFTHVIKSHNLDVTVEQWSTLNIVSKFPGVSQSEIARMAQTDKTNVTRMLDLLEKKTYIDRKSDPHDRRVYRIHLTPEGEHILKAVTPLAQEVNCLASTGLTKQEVALLKKMLKQIRHNLEGEL